MLTLRCRPVRALALVTAAGVLFVATALWAQNASPLRLPGWRGGEALTEADLGRGTTVVVVWATWSPRCRDLAQRLRTLTPMIQGRGRLLSVNLEESADTVGAFLAREDLGVPTYLDADGAFARRYAISTLPGLLVLKDGEVAYRGRLPDSPQQVLESVLN